MKRYKKFNNYLLTYQPLLWHSMFIQHTAAMLGVNLIFFGLGFFAVDFSDIVSSWFYAYTHFTGTKALFWVILGLVILVFWGAHFYRNNPGKNLYPISKWYYQKLALFIFIPVSLFFMAPISFYYGVHTKIEFLIPEKVIEQFKFDYAVSSPFLVKDKNYYHYTERVYPEQYKHVSYWDKNSGASLYLVFNGEQQKIEDIIAQTNALPIHKDIYAFRTKLIEKKNNNEKKKFYEECIFYFYTPSTLPDFHEYHIKNFNPYRVAIHDDEELMANIYKNADGINWMENYHHWIDHDPIKIKQSMLGLKNVMELNNLRFNLNVDEHYENLVNSNFDVHLFLENATWPVFDKINHSDAKSFIHKIDRARNSINKNEKVFVVWVLLCFALATTVLLMYFEWGKVLSLVIALPIGGGIIIVLSLVFAMTNMNATGTKFIIMLVAGFILYLALRNLSVGKTNLMNKVALVLSYFFFPLWFLMIVLFVQEAMDYSRFSFNFGDEPLLSIVRISPFILFFISLGYIKKILAKKE